MTYFLNFQEARDAAMGCTKCGLHTGRTQVVWMDGNPDSKLMFIGEAPGKQEDLQGKPFVGPAGKLLDQMLASIGLDRSGCTICNVLKCRPPFNRDPTDDEISTCSPYLKAQIQFIEPKVVVTLGNFATRYLLQQKISISKARGRKYDIEGLTVIPTFHPAAVLHSGGERSPAMAALRTDFEFIKKVLLKDQPSAPAGAPDRSGADAKNEVPAHQDSLF